MFVVAGCSSSSADFSFTPVPYTQLPERGCPNVACSDVYSLTEECGWEAADQVAVVVEREHADDFMNVQRMRDSTNSIGTSPRCWRRRISSWTCLLGLFPMRLPSSRNARRVSSRLIRTEAHGSPRASRRSSRIARRRRLRGTAASCASNSLAELGHSISSTGVGRRGFFASLRMTSSGIVRRMKKGRSIRAALLL